MKDAYVTMIREDKDKMEKIKVGPPSKEKDHNVTLPAKQNHTTLPFLFAENGG